MVFTRAGKPLELQELPEPEPAEGQVLLRVRACGVCRTDLHVVDGELAEPKLPLILGHQIVGEVSAVGAGVDEELVGQRLGVPWVGATCGACAYCRCQRENLCDEAIFTGYTRDGGFAELAVADHRYCFRLPDEYDDASAAPLLSMGARASAILALFHISCPTVL